MGYDISSGKLQLAVTNSSTQLGNGTPVESTQTTMFASNSWQAIALTKSGNDFKAYVNGINVISGTVSGDWTERVIERSLRLSEMSGQALLNLMREQAVEYGTDYRRAQVFGVDVNGDWKTVFTPEGTFKTRALVLASGAMGRPASFKGEADFLGRGVSYCATCDGAFYRGREVAVVGVNKEAIEEAQVLTKFASTVHWITSNDPKDNDLHAKDLISHPNVRHWSKTKLLQIDMEQK